MSQKKRNTARSERVRANSSAARVSAVSLHSEELRLDYTDVLLILLAFY